MFSLAPFPDKAPATIVRSLVATVFGYAVLPRGGRVSLGSIIQLLQPPGVCERLVRTAVFRLGMAVTSVSPRVMGVGPLPAVQKVLAQT
ncbi:MAG: hypothetical protein ORN28_05465 [Rhodoferax sp.]|nr:hypothetical protein [Rhodoferax sp.]